MTVFNNNQQYERLGDETIRCVLQLRNEIAAETIRPRPDPLELGNRYAEIELICRFLESERQRLVEGNVSVLSEEQRTRLRSLEEAIKLLPVIVEAQAVRLMEGVPSPFRYGGLPVVGDPGSTGGFILVQETPVYGGCVFAHVLIEFPGRRIPINREVRTENRTPALSQ